jgi:hypothetical protein
MTKNILYISWIIFFLAGFHLAFSQGSILVKDSVDRRAILIGEPIGLTLEAQFPPGTASAWFSTDSLVHFEFIERGRIDSETSIDGKSYRQHFVITSFDSGTWVIPAFSIIVNNKKFSTDSILVYVDFSKFDPKQDYHDIKDILDVQNPYIRYINWVLAGLTLICLALFIYFSTRKKIIAPPEKIAVPRISPFEEAMLAIEALKKRQLGETGQIKLFYTELNDIMRVFVLRKMHIASMERTNEELILQFRPLNLSNEQFSRLAQVLRIIDFVKFAKYLPTEKDDRENLETIRSSIELLNTMEK